MATIHILRRNRAAAQGIERHPIAGDGDRRHVRIGLYLRIPGKRIVPDLPSGHAGALRLIIGRRGHSVVVSRCSFQRPVDVFVRVQEVHVVDVREFRVHPYGRGLRISRDDARYKRGFPDKPALKLLSIGHSRRGGSGHALTRRLVYDLGIDLFVSIVEIKGHIHALVRHNRPKKRLNGPAGVYLNDLRQRAHRQAGHEHHECCQQGHCFSQIRFHLRILLL